MKRYSYTQISMYKTCPAKYRYRYEEKIPEVKSDSAQRGTDSHAIVEAFIGGATAPLPPALSYYQQFLTKLRDAGAQAELKIAVDKDWNNVGWTADTARFVAVLDAALVQTPKLTVWDWKTGKIYEDDHMFQRKVYAATVLNLVPGVETVECVHTYIDLGKNRTNTFAREQILPIQKQIDDRIALMEADKQKIPNPNFGCRWCSFSKAKGGPCQF